jgi:hypothetical protein
MGILNIGPLSNTSFSAMDDLITGSVNNLGGGNYSVSTLGGSIFDNWIGSLGSPDPSDIVSNSVTVADPSRDVIQYTFTYGDGSHSAQVGAEVIAYNSNSVLIEQINNYIKGEASFTLNPNAFQVLSTGNLSSTFGTPPAANLLFGQTGASNLVPEPSTIALLPLLVVAMMVSRLPAVRGFFGTR